MLKKFNGKFVAKSNTVALYVFQYSRIFAENSSRFFRGFCICRLANENFAFTRNRRWEMIQPDTTQRSDPDINLKSILLGA